MVLDRRGRVGDDMRLFDEGEVMVIRESETLPETMRGLYERGVTSVLVEGGAEVLSSFLSEGLWDEIRIEVSPVKIDGQVKAPVIPSIDIIPQIQTVDGHKILTYTKY